MAISNTKLKTSTTSKTEAKAKTKTATATKSSASTKASASETKAKTKSKIYHVSKRKEDSKWIIKLEGSDKVIKTFATKVEAEEYVDGLAERQDGSVKMRASKGKNAGKFIKR